MSTRHKTEKELILDNNGRNVSIRVPERSFVYQGPKNLVKFRKIVSIRHDVVYVECCFRNEDDSLYVEEDYIDLRDVFDGCTDLLTDSYKVILASQYENELV